MKKSFPRTEVAGISLPRMLIGMNWMLGWSHQGPASDKRIKEKFAKPEDFFPMFEAFLEYDIDAAMSIFGETPLAADAIAYAQDKTGRKIHMIDTPIINVDDNADARREAEAVIRRAGKNGATFCFLHHTSAEQLVNKNKKTMDRLPDYLQMIRDNGMIPGLSAHMPELIQYSDENEYDVQTYIQIYNCLGFLMQIEVETIAGIIHAAKKPVMTIKSMAAGRTTPYVGLNFSWATLRAQDMVTVGCFTPHEVHEDVEISFAALERRFPNF